MTCEKKYQIDNSKDNISLIEKVTVGKEYFPDPLCKSKNAERIVILKGLGYNFENGRDLFSHFFGGSVEAFENTDSSLKRDLCIDLKNQLCYSFLKALETATIIEVKKDITIIIRQDSQKKIKYVINKGAIYFNIGYYKKSTQLKRDIICVLYHNGVKEMITFIKKEDITDLMRDKKVKLNPYLLALKYNVENLLIGMNEFKDFDSARDSIINILFSSPVFANSYQKLVTSSEVNSSDSLSADETYVFDKDGNSLKIKFTGHIWTRQEERGRSDEDDHSKFINTIEHGEKKIIENYKQYSAFGYRYLVLEKCLNYILKAFVIVLIVGVDKKFFENHFEQGNKFQKDLIKFNKFFLNLFFKSLDLEKIRPAKIKKIPKGSHFLFFKKNSKTNIYYYLVYEIIEKCEGYSKCELKLEYSKSYDEKMVLKEIDTKTSGIHTEGTLPFDTSVFSLNYFDQEDVGLVNIAVTIFQDSS